MIALPPGRRVLVATEPVDFRRGMDSLAALVETHLHETPFGGDVFVFRSRRRADRLKLLVWDGTGLVLVTKRLEGRHFTFPPIRDGVCVLSPLQMAMLLEGLDWASAAPKAVRRPRRAA
jgi:transposase